MLRDLLAFCDFKQIKFFGGNRNDEGRNLNFVTFNSPQPSLLWGRLLLLTALVAPLER